MQLSDYYGRRLLVDHLTLNKNCDPHIKTLPTIEVHSKTIRCLRCGERTSKEVARLPNNEYYCPACINLGRVSTLNKFYHVPEPNQFTVTMPVLTWHGQLSSLQAQAAAKIRQGMTQHRRQLLWAVTGAGKTEMIFQGIAAALERGERVAVASPRIDVCLELYPRLKAAFSNTSMVLLHGRQEEPYRYAQLTVCTTHQLLRFYRAFDNLVVDEVDAFPYAENPRLYFASCQAIKLNGGCLYLTATPGKVLLRQVKQHRLTVTYLPLRYHGHTLPVIKCRLVPQWRRILARNRLPNSLITQLKISLKCHHPFLLFLPHIADLAPVARALHYYLPATRFTTVHAKDQQRLLKVQKMRQGVYDFLLTTTILERGVTFPSIDVYVLGADDSIFSSSALVQIAGRAGRSAKRPDGTVVFWLTSRTRQVRTACQQVRFLNRKGNKVKNEMFTL